MRAKLDQPKQIGPYIVDEGFHFKAIYFGEHAETGQRVVLKKPDPIAFSREEKPLDIARSYLKYEYDIQRGFDHPNVCTALGLEMHNGEYHLVVPEVGTTTLQDIVEDERTPKARIVSALADIADALLYLHSQDIIHLDVKEENAMVNGHGTLIDHAAARRLGTEHPISNSWLLCTKEYMAPEYGFGIFTPSTDTFSFAMMAYRTLLGSEPFPVTEQGDIVYDTPLFTQEKQDALGDLGELVVTSFRMDHNRRPPMAEFAQALREQASKLDPQQSEVSSALSLSASQ